MFSTINTRDEDCHWLICAPSLHLIIRALSLPAACAQELIGRHGPVALQLPLLTNLLLIELISPPGRKEFICIHPRNHIEGRLTILEELEEIRVLDIGFRVKVTCNVPQMHLVQMDK
jgi:hypothetical protein